MSFHEHPRVHKVSESVRLLDHHNSHINIHAPGPKTTSPSTVDPLRSLNVASLSLLIFFAVCGGPYGMEQAISTAPPLVILIVFISLPWIWSLPIGLCTSELAAAFPDEGGGPIEWIFESFGFSASKVAALWYWLSCTTDNVLYAVLLPFYLEHAFTISFGYEGRYCIGAFMLIIIGIINIAGIDVLNSSSMLLGGLAMLPIIIICLFAIPYQDPAVWISTTDHNGQNIKIQWALLLALSVWGNSGYDDLGSLVEHVHNPQKTYPRAMFLTCFLVTFVNTIPIIMSMCVDYQWQNFNEGYFSQIAQMLGGPYLRVAVTLGSAVALFSELNVLLLVTAKAVQYMGKQYMLPIPYSWSKALTLERENGAPWVAIIITVILTGSLLFFDFELMAELHTGYYAIIIGMELVAVIALRFSRPDLHRPYVIPGGMPSLFLMSVFPFFIILFNLSLTSTNTQLVMGGTFVFSLLILCFDGVYHLCCNKSGRDYTHYGYVDSDGDLRGQPVQPYEPIKQVQ